MFGQRYISWIFLISGVFTFQEGSGQDVTLTLDEICYNNGESMTLSVTYGSSDTVSGVEWFYSGRDSRNIIVLTDCSVFQTDTGFPSGITYKCPPDTVDSNTYQLSLGSVSAGELDTTTWGATFLVSGVNPALETVQPVSCKIFVTAKYDETTWKLLARPIDGIQRDANIRCRPETVHATVSYRPKVIT